MAHSILNWVLSIMGLVAPFYLARSFARYAILCEVANHKSSVVLLGVLLIDMIVSMLGVQYGVVLYHNFSGIGSMGFWNIRYFYFLEVS